MAVAAAAARVLAAAARLLAAAVASSTGMAVTTAFFTLLAVESSFTGSAIVVGTTRPASTFFLSSSCRALPSSSKTNVTISAASDMANAMDGRAAWADWKAANAVAEGSSDRSSSRFADIIWNQTERNLFFTSFPRD